VDDIFESIGSDDGGEKKEEEEDEETPEEESAGDTGGKEMDEKEEGGAGAEGDTDEESSGGEDDGDGGGEEGTGTDVGAGGSVADEGHGTAGSEASTSGIGGTETERTGAGTPEESEEGPLGSVLSTAGVYLANHTAHIAVVVVLGLYPGVHHVVTGVFPPAGFVLPPVDMMVAVFYFGLFAVSFDFISGYTGYLSLGHAAFYGIGAYSVLMVANGLVPFIPPDTWFMISILFAGLVSIFFAVVIGLVSFRLRGFYFAMITLGFTQVMYVFMTRWTYPVAEGRDPSFGISANPDVPGFEIGIPFIDVVSLDFSNEMLAIGRIQGDSVTSLFGTGIELSPASVSYYLVGIVVLLCYLIMQRIIHSPFGSVLVAIRENEERARAVGYNVFAYKIAAFSISAFFAAMAGGLFAGYRRSVTPDGTFFFMRSADAILATVIGGFGTLAGPIYGRTLQAVVENFLGNAPFVPGFLQGQDVLFLGVLFVVIVLYLPTGIVGAVRSRLGGKVADVVGRKVRNYFANF
jgi:branched-chain amino acid transport system permease protein